MVETGRGCIDRSSTCKYFGDEADMALLIGIHVLKDQPRATLMQAQTAVTPSFASRSLAFTPRALPSTARSQS